MRFTQRPLIATALVSAFFGVAGCGSTDHGATSLAQEQQLQQARSDAARSQRQDDRIRQLEQQARHPGGVTKGGDRQAPTPDRAPPATMAPSSVNFSPCDANIAVAGGATCAFAENSFYEYYLHQGVDSFSVYSPSTDATYTMTCGANGANIVCTNGQGAATRFSQAAVGAYSQAQADRYAATHNIGH